MKIQNLYAPDIRMKDVERILRFFAFADRGIHNYKSPPKTFLNNYMEEKREISDKEYSEKTALFKKCAELCNTVFGRLSARRWMQNYDVMTGSLGTTLNDGILDMQMIGFVEYEKRDIVRHAQVIRDAYIGLVCQRNFAETVEIGTYST